MNHTYTLMDVVGTPKALFVYGFVWWSLGVAIGATMIYKWGR